MHRFKHYKSVTQQERLNNFLQVHRHFSFTHSGLKIFFKSLTCDCKEIMTEKQNKKTNENVNPSSLEVSSLMMIPLMEK